MIRHVAHPHAAAVDDAFVHILRRHVDSLAPVHASRDPLILCAHACSLACSHACPPARTRSRCRCYSHRTPSAFATCSRKCLWQRGLAHAHRLRTIERDQFVVPYYLWKSNISSGLELIQMDTLQRELGHCQIPGFHQRWVLVAATLHARGRNQLHLHATANMSRQTMLRLLRLPPPPVAGMRFSHRPSPTTRRPRNSRRIARCCAASSTVTREEWREDGGSSCQTESSISDVRVW